MSSIAWDQLNTSEVIKSIREYDEKSYSDWDNNPENTPEFFANYLLKVSRRANTPLERYYLGLGFDIGLDVARFVIRLMGNEMRRSSHKNNRPISYDDIIHAFDCVSDFFKDLNDKICGQSSVTLTEEEIQF